MDRFEKPFYRAKRALAHLMFKDHEFHLTCHGCLEIAGFLVVEGYKGDMDYPVGVNFDVPR